MSRLLLFTGALIGLCALAGPTLAQTPDTLRPPPAQPPAQPPARPPVAAPRADTDTAQPAVDSAAAAAPDSLRVSRSSRWGRQYAVLAWVGGAARVEIVRDDAVRASIPNTGQYRDRLREEDIGSEASHGITYRVCNAGAPARCSQAVVVQY
ncbi:MAG TPA: hypothetical protein VHQ45_08355 [Gemmatimonadaceae bacterium]|nr:hypothetical protein [Gemmatimonadaceae bacterium]